MTKKAPTLAGSKGGSGFKGEWAVESILAFVGAVALVGTWPGVQLTKGLSFVGGVLGGWGDIGAGPVLALAAVIAAVIVVLDLKDKKADKPAIICLILIPLLVAGASGIPGDASQLMDAVRGGAQSAFNRLLAG